MRTSRRSLGCLPRQVDEQPKTRGRPRARGIVFLVCVGVYIVTYVTLSWHGRYIGHNQGGNDNRDSWFPAYCAEPYVSPAGRLKVRLTALGWLFLPPMLIDQIAIHRTRFDTA